MARFWPTQPSALEVTPREMWWCLGWTLQNAPSRDAWDGGDLNQVPFNGTFYCHVFAFYHLLIPFILVSSHCQYRMVKCPQLNQRCRQRYICWVQHWSQGFHRNIFQGEEWKCHLAPTQKGWSCHCTWFWRCIPPCSTSSIQGPPA